MIWMTSGTEVIMTILAPHQRNINNGIVMSGDEEYLDVAYNPSEEKIYFTGYDGVGLLFLSGWHWRWTYCHHLRPTGPLALITLTTRSIGCDIMLEIILSGTRTWMGRLLCQYCQTEIMRLLVWMCTLNRTQYTLLRAMPFIEWH